MAVTILSVGLESVEDLWWRQRADDDIEGSVEYGDVEFAHSMTEQEWQYVAQSIGEKLFDPGDYEEALLAALGEVRVLRGQA